MKLNPSCRRVVLLAGAGAACLSCGGCAAGRSSARRYLDAGMAEARAGRCDAAIERFGLAVESSRSDENCRRERVSAKDDSLDGWVACTGVLADAYSGLARCYHDLGRPGRAIEQKKNDAATCRALCEVAQQTGRASLKRWCANAAKALATLADWQKAAGP
jgi:hypothetical protein